MILKRILLMFAVLSAVCGMKAQSYDELWKQAGDAAKKDLPKTALGHVRKIHEKAMAEGNDAQLLRAALMYNVYGGEISPDTSAVCVERMESARSAESRTVVKALWDCALAQVYQSRLYDGSSAGEDRDIKKGRIRTHLESSLQYPKALSEARYTDWLPLMDSKADSRYFGNDLLHVLLQTYMNSEETDEKTRLSVYGRMIQLYKSKGNADAALLLALDSVQLAARETAVSGKLEENAAFARLMKLAAEYEARPVNVRTYERLIQYVNYVNDRQEYAAHNTELLVKLARRGVELYGNDKETGKANALRNFISAQQNPKASLERMKDEMYAGETQELTLRARHLTDVQLRVTYLYKATDRTRRRYDEQKKYCTRLAAKNRAKSRTQTFRFKATDPWRWQEQKIAFAAPAETGVYWVELLVNGKSHEEMMLSVSNIRALVFSYPTEKNRVVVVDSRTGRPAGRAKITACNREGNQVRSYTTDEQGMVTIETTDRNYLNYYAETQSDKSSGSFSLSRYSEPYKTDEAYTRVDLFTDRAIYRPGQEVKFSGVVYNRRNDDFRVVSNHETTVELYNANHKRIDSLLVKTDDFGNFSGTFRLPEVCLTGYFRIATRQGQVGGSEIFRVEEYKRPTFTAEAEPVKVAFQLGDTVKACGVARTYTGVPVAGARVQYNVHRSMWFRWADDNFSPQHGETVTDADGRFVMPVALSATERERDARRQNRFFYTVNFTVTAENGETAQGTTTLQAANFAAVYECNIPETVCKEQMPAFTVSIKNASGQTLEGTQEYTLDDCNGHKLNGSFTSGKTFGIPALVAMPSGLYRMYLPAAQGAKADTVSFVLFSEKDSRPADKMKPLFVHVRTSEKNDSAFVLIGTPEKEVDLYYDLLTEKGLVESRRITLSDSLLRFNLQYRAEYGDAATAYFAFVRNGKIYQFRTNVSKPEPDKRLVLTWNTFRSRLTPGQQETWELNVRYPDGTPARTNVIARLYDASLDAFAKKDWRFSSVYFTRQFPYGSWQWNDYGRSWRATLDAVFDYKTLATHHWQFASWKQELFNYYYGGSRLYGNKLYSVNPNKEESALEGAVEGVQVSRKSMKQSAAKGVMADMAAPAPAPMENASAATEAGGTAQSVTPRSNFSETAFFRPALRTDGQGRVSIAFTLPESMTQWRFSALAYDRDMRNGTLDTTVVARKEFMVEPAMPRFVRRGDRISLPVKVTNLSDNPLTADLHLTLADAVQTDRTFGDYTRQIEIAAGESRVFTFDYQATDDTELMVCRATAAGGGFSDGEEHYLPVLSDLIEVTRTLPFSMTDKGRTELRIDTLFHSAKAVHKSLTVEMSSNPSWYVVSALPALAGSGNSVSATEWATRFYALALGDRLAQMNPAIRKMVEAHSDEADVLSRLQGEGLTDDTPWLRKQNENRERTKALKRLFDAEWSAANRYTAIDKLAALQRPDGAWSWYPGMPGNNYITVDVAIMLARVQRLAENYEARTMLEKAVKYLKIDMARQVKNMKKAEKETKMPQHPSEVQLRYLYLLTLLGERPNDDARYLIDRAATLNKELTMYGKAVSAIFLAEFGKEDASKLALQSMMEHTVANKETGRWFDTPRAEWSWNAYRIPTQCAAIEALTYYGKDAEADAFRLWLLQAKRTQMWETSRATADAVYALLSTAGKTYSVTDLAETTPLYYTLYKGKKIIDAPALSSTQAAHTVGYVRKTYTDAADVQATTLHIAKRTDGLSWGSVFATCQMPQDKVKTEGKGFTLYRSFEVKRDGIWVDVSESTILTKGDRVRQTFTLYSDRDYDFVSIESARPACLEPAVPFSGYQWNGSGPAYRAVRDTSTQYFFEKVRKGANTFSEEFFVDRAGTYSTGISRVRCEFAPEFTGTAASVKIQAK